jgi:hypothetical protein
MGLDVGFQMLHMLDPASDTWQDWSTPQRRIKLFRPEKDNLWTLCRHVPIWVDFRKIL